jgi:hypothetical protein
LKASTPRGADRGQSRGRGRGRGGRNNNHRGNQQQYHQHQESQFQGRGRGHGSHHSTTYKSTNKSNVECYRCHRYDHYNLNRQGGEKTNFAKKKEDASLLMVCHMKEETQQNMRYVDIGCNSHVWR